jgi:hypothetical protein
MLGSDIRCDDSVSSLECNRHQATEDAQKMVCFGALLTQRHGSSSVSGYEACRNATEEGEARVTTGIRCN